MRSLHTGVYRISLKKCPGAYFKFQLKRWALLEGGSFFEGSAYLRFSLNEIEDDQDVPGKFTAFKNEAMGKRLKNR